MNRTQAPEQLFGFDVLDSGGAKIGRVDNIWVDDSTGQLEFIGVQTGWLGMGKDHLIPAAAASIDFGNQTIQVPYVVDQVKGAPTYATDAQLQAEDEDRMYSYYGFDRSTAPSPTGLAGAGGMASTSGTAATGMAATGTSAMQDRTDITGQGEMRVPLAEEQLQVGKRQVETGRVHLRKIVRTEQVSQPVELRREEVHVERVPGSGTVAPGELPEDAFQEKDIEVKAMQEEPVVSKQARVTGEVRVGKTAETETRNVQGDVRKEDVVVDEGAEADRMRSGQPFS